MFMPLWIRCNSPFATFQIVSSNKQNTNTQKGISVIAHQANAISQQCNRLCEQQIVSSDSRWLTFREWWVANAALCTQLKCQTFVSKRLFYLCSQTIAVWKQHWLDRRRMHMLCSWSASLLTLRKFPPLNELICFHRLKDNCLLSPVSARLF